MVKKKESDFSQEVADKCRSGIRGFKDEDGVSVICMTGDKKKNDYYSNTNNYPIYNGDDKNYDNYSGGRDFSSKGDKERYEAYIGIDGIDRSNSGANSQELKEQADHLLRHQQLMKGFTGQTLGGYMHNKIHCRNYEEKPNVNKEMLAAVRKVDRDNNAQAINFILFHKHYLNDDDMYWLSSIFNTHTPKGLAVNTVDLSNNCLKLEQDNGLPFFSFKPYNQVRNILRIDLSNNNIGDYGAKVVADGLANGVFPITKQINLSGNKITEKGESYFVKLLKEDSTVQRIAILLEDLGQNLKIQSGKKEHVVPELNKILKKAQDRGVDVKNMVVDLSFLTWVKNMKGMVEIATRGFIKCKWTDDPVGDWAKGELAAKLPEKTGKIVTKSIDTESTVSCFIKAYDKAATSEFGAQMAINDLYVIGENYVQDNME